MPQDKPPKDQFGAMLKNKKSLTPKRGYNVVGLDDFETAGDQLYLVGHYKTRAEAEAALKKKQQTRKNNDDKLFIYGDRDE